MIAIKNCFKEITGYFNFLFGYIHNKTLRWFGGFETRKGKLVNFLTAQRGRWSRPFIHSGVAGLVFLGITLGPNLIARSKQTVMAEETAEIDYGDGMGGVVLGATSFLGLENVNTQISEKPRAEVVLYTIQDGDTVGKIAEKFGISDDTIYWENNITPKTKLKPGETLRILPVSGVKHTVARGETVHNIADKYDVSAQAIVDWPFNTFTNDETFALAVGQILIVPDGVKPEEKPVSPRQYLARQTPDAGTVVASGTWVWPAAGRLTQYYVWYHPGLDIANKAGPAVVAADSGRVVAVNGGRFGYGNHVIIDHGNGYTTLYGHLASFAVSQGQNISKGAVLGTMGSTGRSTGTHLHFEIRQNGAAQNPLNYLK